MQISHRDHSSTLSFDKYKFLNIENLKDSSETNQSCTPTRANMSNRSDHVMNRDKNEFSLKSSRK